MTVQNVSIGSKAEAHGAEGHSCGCGEESSNAIELDARAIPHAVRHAAIMGSLEAIKPGISLDLIAPHDPLPLLAQIEAKFDGAFTVTYLEQGPEKWVLRFTR